ncbi:cupin domain-containing protein [Sphingomonas sp. GCM10030256]|uniref:cupin domain-containing protein n=1 Tax=Sphingomonas sp. GCM10030256 TaxID=3273427 RepID=UPI0036129A9C
MMNRCSPLLFAIAALLCGAPVIAQPHQEPTAAGASKPLVLQPGDGEPRMRRPPPSSLSTLAAPFLIKVDEQNGGAKDFVIFTEDVPVGQTISPHRHPHSEEILFIHAGTGTAWLDGKQAKVGPGTIIFMPPHTGVRLTNDGKQPISLMAIFSRPGFDKYQRDISVPAGQPAKPLTVEELTAIRAKHTDSVLYDPLPSKAR